MGNIVVLIFSRHASILAAAPCWRCSEPKLKISTTMRVLNIAALAIIFAVVRSTTSTASGQRWATKPYETPIRPNVHAPQPRPVTTQKPGMIPETSLMSGDADAEENIVLPLVMTEDNAMMQSEELSHAPESNEAMIEEMSEDDEMISIHEFKEVLHEFVKDAVDKIVMKKAGIVGKLKTAKLNSIGHDGEASGRDPQRISSSHSCSVEFGCRVCRTERVETTCF